MYVSDDMIRRMEDEYGVPGQASFAFDLSADEHTRISSSQKNGRNHDVTLYIRKGDKLVVIAKPFYPPGMYRAPSGGLMPGESFIDGINREIAEETGCEIRLDRFILRTSVSFVLDRKTIAWRSFVFTADYMRGDFLFTDRREIREVRLVAWEDFQTFGEIMRNSKIAGLHYRAALHDAVVKLLSGN